MKQKKSQINIGETVGVIIFFSLIMIFSLGFFIKQNASGIEKKRVEKSFEEVTNIAKTIQMINELKCSLLGTESVGCLDFEKLKAFSQEIQQNSFAFAYYKNIFKTSMIRVRVVYSYDHSYENFTIYNYTGNYPNSIFFSIPIRLYDPIQKLNKVAMLDIYYYVP